MRRREIAHRLEQPQRAHGNDVGRVGRYLEGDAHMALTGKIVDLVRLHLLEHAVQRAPVGQIGIVERLRDALGMRAP